VVSTAAVVASTAVVVVEEASTAAVVAAEDIAKLHFYCAQRNGLGSNDPGPFRLCLFISTQNSPTLIPSIRREFYAERERARHRKDPSHTP
jgi:hypothetical protein